MPAICKPKMSRAAAAEMNMLPEDMWNALGAAEIGISLKTQDLKFNRRSRNGQDWQSHVDCIRLNTKNPGVTVANEIGGN